MTGTLFSFVSSYNKNIVSTNIIEHERFSQSQIGHFSSRIYPSHFYHPNRLSPIKIIHRVQGKPRPGVQKNLIPTHQFRINKTEAKAMVLNLGLRSGGPKGSVIQSEWPSGV